MLIQNYMEASSQPNFLLIHPEGVETETLPTSVRLIMIPISHVVVKVSLSQCRSTLWSQRCQATAGDSVFICSFVFHPNNNLGPEPSPDAPVWPASKALLPGKSLILQCNLCSATGVTCCTGGLAVRNGAGMSSCLFPLLPPRVSGQGLPLHPGAAASRNTAGEGQDWLTCAVLPS